MSPITDEGQIPEDIVELIRQAPVFQKTGKVTAYKVDVDTPLQTVLADGFVETSRVVPAGSYIVTNPGGEQYGIDEVTFMKRYEFRDGEWHARGQIQAIRNPWGSDTEIVASWGEPQFGDAKCWLAIPVGSDESPYIIAGDAFAETYALLTP